MDTELLDRFGKNVDYRKIISEKKPYKDPLFLPCSSTLYNENTSETTSSSLISTEENTHWVKPIDIFQGEDFDVFCGISPGDIIQGAVGNCYFLAAVAALAEKPERIEKLFLTREKNEAGCYAMYGFISGLKHKFVIDDYFLCYMNNKPAFSRNKDPELWVMLLEKAWAKANGCYGNSASGTEHESLYFLTGVPWSEIRHDDLSPDEAWARLLSGDQADMIMVASCGHRNDISEAEYESKGLVKNHAYSLIGCAEIKRKDGSVHRLLQLRNPWGETEWNGPWGDHSPEWNEKLLQKFGHRRKDDGLFFMPLESYLRFFNSTTICDFKDDYSHSCCQIDHIHECFTFKIDETTKGSIGVCQLLERLGKKQFGSSYSTACLSLMLGKINGDRIELISSKGEQKVITIISFRTYDSEFYNNYEECFMPVELRPGTYIALTGVCCNDPAFNLKRAMPMIKSYADHQIIFHKVPGMNFRALAEKLFLQHYDKEDDLRKSDGVDRFIKIKAKNGLGLICVRNNSSRNMKVDIHFDIEGLNIIYPEENVEDVQFEMKPGESSAVVMEFNSGSYSYSTNYTISSLGELSGERSSSEEVMSEAIKLAQNALGSSKTVMPEKKPDIPQKIELQEPEMHAEIEPKEPEMITKIDLPEPEMIAEIEPVEPETLLEKEEKSESSEENNPDIPSSHEEKSEDSISKSDSDPDPEPEEPPKPPMEEKKLSGNVSYCSQGHALEWSFAEYNCGMYGCDKCGKVGGCDLGRMHCHECEYDLCNDCAPARPTLVICEEDDLQVQYLLD